MRDFRKELEEMRGCHNPETDYPINLIPLWFVESVLEGNEQLQKELEAKEKTNQQLARYIDQSDEKMEQVKKELVKTQNGLNLRRNLMDDQFVEMRRLNNLIKQSYSLEEIKEVLSWRFEQSEIKDILEELKSKQSDHRDKEEKEPYKPAPLIEMPYKKTHPREENEPHEKEPKVPTREEYYKLLEKKNTQIDKKEV